MPPASTPFRVLYVCTGNICRSAAAERLLRRELRERLGADAGLFLVESAGVHGLVGEPMDTDSAAALAALGGDSSGFIARKLDADLVHDADLIMTANRKHRANVVRLDPTAARRAFTIREFALLANSIDPQSFPDVDPASRLAAMVEEVGAARGTVRPDDRQDFDVADPYGGPPELHRTTVDLISEATARTASLMATAARPGLLVKPSAKEPKATEEAAPSLEPAKPQLRREKPRRRLLVVALGLLLVTLLASASWLAWSGLSAKHELEASRPLIGEARTAVLDGNATQARATVATLQEHTSTAKSRTSGPVWALAAKAPLLGDDIDAVRSVTAAVDEVAQTILPPLLKVSDAVRPEKLRTSGNRINLAPLQDAAPTLSQAADRSTAVQSQVDAVAIAGLTAPVARTVADVRSNVNDLVSTTDSASRAAELIPPLLGADGKRRYFLAFQNNAEARGTGGLLGAYGVLEANNGRVRVLQLGPNTELDNPKRLPIDLGGDYDALYGRTPPLWVNGNVSSHFPYAGRIWTAMWEQQFGQQLDGVIATDPVALGYVLKATGPATLPGGGQVTADNAVQLTMKDVYERFPSGAENAVRDRYLQGVAGAVFAKLLAGEGDPKALADQLTKTAGERRLLIYSAHSAEQRRLEETSLGGAIPQEARPFAGLVLNNYSGSKLDYYVDRSLRYTRPSCSGAKGRVISRVGVTLKNNAPERGLPAYVDQRLDSDNFPGRDPKGANTDLVQIFATGGSELIRARADGKDLLVTAGEEQGKAVFEFNLTLLAGQSRTIVLDLSEPPSLGKPELMEPQPLVRPMRQRAVVTDC